MVVKEKEYMNREIIREFRRTINMTERLRRHHSHPVMNTLNAESGQGRVLLLLSRSEKISQKELLLMLDCRPQSLAEILKKLEFQGLIERFPSEADRRVLDIRLTDEGRGLAEAISERTRSERNPLEKSFEVLTEEEKLNMYTYLKKINSSLENEMIESGFEPRRGHGRRRGSGKGYGRRER